MILVGDYKPGTTFVHNTEQVPLLKYLQASASENSVMSGSKTK